MSDATGLPHRMRPGSASDADAWRAHLVLLNRLLDEHARGGEWPESAEDWPDPEELGPLPSELAAEAAALRARLEQQAEDVARRMHDVGSQLEALRAVGSLRERTAVYVDVDA